MGTLFQLTLHTDDPAAADRAAAAAFECVDRVAEVATDYVASSEARQLPGRGALGWTPVSEPLADVLRAADRWVRASGGAFDPTVGALTPRWRRALRRGEWPDPAGWSEGRGAVGWAEHVELREVAEGLEFRAGRPGLRLDFGAVAKGVAVDAALRAVERAGVHRALMDGGGDVCALDPPPGEAGWRVEVRPFGDGAGPRFRFLLRRAAIATSGDAYRSGELGGVPLTGLRSPGIGDAASHYGHVIDPRTALPLPSPRAALMTAPSAAAADALATARMVLGPAGPGDTERGDEAPLDPALECGVFFPGAEMEPCVGRRFPHDGAALLADGASGASPADLPLLDPQPRPRDE